MEAALRVLLPKIRPEIEFDIHAFQGVNDMLTKLPNRLRGYAGWIPKEYRLVIVRDEDRKPCAKLKADIANMIVKAGLKPKIGKASGFNVLTRIAVEELEAWLLGDVPALCATYEGVAKNIGNRRGFRDVDEIDGGTWEALERVLQKAGHFLNGLPKIQVAREVAANMDPSKNTSKSFQVFRDGLRAL